MNGAHKGLAQPSPGAGNVLILALVILVFLMSLIAAQVAVTQSSVRQSDYYLSRAELYTYAESAIDLALHDLQYEVTGNEGKVGTVNWSPGDDTGRDGRLGSGDEGEGDGIPTPGEPNVIPVPVGPQELGVVMISWIDELAPGVRRAIATAASGNASVTVEKAARETAPTIPLAGAFYLDSSVSLDLQGNAFRISGNDTNPDGTRGPAAPLPGVSVEEGASADIYSEVGRHSRQVTGEGGQGSIGEATSTDFDRVFDQFKAIRTKTLPPGTYSQPASGMGDWAAGNYEVTYVKGDLELNGRMKGAGVLVVEGNLNMSGQATFYGVVIVKGNASLSGGGAGVHVFGTMMVGETAPQRGRLSVAGTSDVFFSSSVLGKVQGKLPFVYVVVFFRER